MSLCLSLSKQPEDTVYIQFQAHTGENITLALNISPVKNSNIGGPAPLLSPKRFNLFPSVLPFHFYLFKYIFLSSSVKIKHTSGVVDVQREQAAEQQRQRHHQVHGALRLAHAGLLREHGKDHERQREPDAAGETHSASQLLRHGRNARCGLQGAPQYRLPGGGRCSQIPLFLTKGVSDV